MTVDNVGSIIAFFFLADYNLLVLQRDLPWLCGSASFIPVLYPCVWREGFARGVDVLLPVFVLSSIYEYRLHLYMPVY